MTQEHPEEPGRVPVSELRALVEEWQSQSESPAVSSAGRRAMELAKARDLEELVEQYE